MKSVRDSNNVVYFNKKTQTEERVFVKSYNDLEQVPRACDPSKGLSEKAQKLLINLATMIQSKRNKQICLTQEHISNFTNRRITQNNVLLNQISDFIKCTYHRSVRFAGRGRNYCYIIEFTEDGEARFKNPSDFYEINGKKSPKKPQENVELKPGKPILIARKTEASDSENRGILHIGKDIGKEKEEEHFVSSSSFSVLEREKEKSIKKKNDLVEEDLFFSSSQNEEVETSAPNASESVNEEIIPPNSLNLEEVIMDKFGSQEGEYITKNCVITQVSPDTVSVKVEPGASLTGHQKQFLRECIKAVFGDNINITTPKVRPPEELWKKFREGMVRHRGNAVVHSWFDSLERSEDHEENKLRLVGNPFMIQHISSNFNTPLDEIAKELNVKIELTIKTDPHDPRYKDMKYEPYAFPMVKQNWHQKTNINKLTQQIFKKDNK